MAFRDFFKRQILIARVFGIPVRIDYRWFLVFAVSVALIAVNVRNRWMQLGVVLLPPTGEFMAWVLGIVTTLALFVSVFGHELSHALMARDEGIAIEEIVLHPFGGLAQCATLPEVSGRIQNRRPRPGASFCSMIAFGACDINGLEVYFAIYLFLFWAAGILARHLHLFGYRGRWSRAARDSLKRREHARGDE